MSVYPQNVPRDSSTIVIKPVVSPEGYYPQDLPCQIYQDSSADAGVFSPVSASEDTSAQSSVSYSALVPAEPTEDQGAFNDPEISIELPFPAAEFGSNRGSRPPLLPMVWDMVWSSDFQSSTANLQRSPLLSKLINSECGEGLISAPTQMYNSHYINTRALIPYLHQESLNSSSTDGRSESCYKQNWIPKANIETVSVHSDSDGRTDSVRSWIGLRDEDDEDRQTDREELERCQLSEHYLGNWQLQIQD